MDYIVQFRVMNPHQQPLLSRQRKPDYNAAILSIYTRCLNQRHIKTLLTKITKTEAQNTKTSEVLVFCASVLVIFLSLSNTQNQFTVHVALQIV